MNNILEEMKFILYHTEEENISVNALIKNETIWLTQKSMAEVFDCSSDNIGVHLKNIYNSEELKKDSTTEKISVVQKEGKIRSNKGI